MTRNLMSCAVLLSALSLCSMAQAQTALSTEEQEAICPLVGELALAASGHRDDKMDQGKAQATVLKEFKVSEKPERMRQVVSTLVQAITEMVYATPSLEGSTEAAFHFASCALGFYQDGERFQKRLPRLLEKAEKCQEDSMDTEGRVKCVLKRFQKD
jgi:hypothetical protein